VELRDESLSVAKRVPAIIADIALPDKFKPVAYTLYHNNGDGTFTDATKRSGFAAATGKGLSVTTCDFDRDGRPDAVVANDTAAQRLFKNNRNGTFTEVGLALGRRTTMANTAGSYLSASPLRARSRSSRPPIGAEVAQPHRPNNRGIRRGTGAARESARASKVQAEVITEREADFEILGLQTKLQKPVIRSRFAVLRRTVLSGSEGAQVNFARIWRRNKRHCEMPRGLRLVPSTSLRRLSKVEAWE